MLNEDFQTRVMKRFEPQRSDLIARIVAAASGERRLGAERDAAALFKVAAKLNACCQCPIVITDDVESRIAIAEMRCKHRLCPRCNRGRMLRIRRRLEQVTQTFDSCRLVTLTLAHSDAPLAEQLKHLRDSFARLRRRKSIKPKVTGGVYSIEITYNADSGQWHPHLHAIVDGDFIEHAVLKREWESITGGARIVDIRYAHQRSVVVGYIVKYVSKGIDAQRFPAHALAEYVPAVSSMRLVGTFGAAHGIPVEQDPAPRWSGETRYVCHYDWLLERSIGGDDDASKALIIITHQTTHAAEHKRNDGVVDPPPDWSTAASEAAAVGDLARCWFWSGKPEPVPIRIPRPPDPMLAF